MPLTTVSHAISPLIDTPEETDDGGFDDGNKLVPIDLFEKGMCKFRQVLLELSDILEYNAPLTDLCTLPVLRRRPAAISDLHTRPLEQENITNSVTGLPPRDLVRPHLPPLNALVNFSTKMPCKYVIFDCLFTCDFLAVVSRILSAHGWTNDLCRLFTALVLFLFRDIIVSLYVVIESLLECSHLGNK